MNFPKYRLDDVVQAQKRLLTEALGIQELVTVVGISYGGRQTWQWGVQYPGFMKGLVPLIASPFPNAGRRGMQDFLPAEAIVSDPTWNNGTYKEQPRNFPLAIMTFWLTLDGAGHLWEVAPTRERSFSYLPEATKQQARSWDANDFLYQMRVNDGFDAFRDLNRVMARVLMINMAGDGLVPVKLGHAEKVLERLGPKADYLLVKEAYGYGHIAEVQTAAVYAPSARPLVAVRLWYRLDMSQSKFGFKLFSARRDREAAMPFIMLTALIDMIAIGLIIPVLPALVGSFTGSQADQAYWYGVVTFAFGLANFFASPVLGALSDQHGRRPLLLLGFCGLALSFFATALATALWMLIAVRLVSGAMQSNLSVANAYVADITPPEGRAKRFGLLGAMLRESFDRGARAPDCLRRWN